MMYGALLLLLAAPSLADLAWYVSIQSDGTTTVQSTRTGQVTQLEVHGFVPREPSSDCSNYEPGAGGNVTCRQWGDFKVQVRDEGRCFHLEAAVTKPVGPELHLSVKRNFSGHLFGGPEQFHQYWPLDDVKFSNYSMVTKQEDNQGIADPYWLGGEGWYVYVHPQTPLFLEQNVEHDRYIKFISRNSAPYPGPKILIHNSTTCEFDEAKTAHLHAVENYLHKPTGIPDERMIRHPVWSTWARYKTNIDQIIVQIFAGEIIKYGFNNSQLEIDDYWEPCYGTFRFDTNKFPNMKALSDKLKKQGFRVTLWVYPFIGEVCDDIYAEALEKGYLVKNTEGSPRTVWWNGEAGVVDFTKPEAVAWWSARLRNMMEQNGIDSLKFDAGETSWMPQPPVLQGDLQLQPSTFTLKYVEATAQFGPAIEVRVGHRSQHLPVFVRMLDKDSRWDFENGLPTLITTLLQMNMVGYTLVLPDMVGGNGYEGAPSKEMFVRWLQANVFMPAIQYSYVPWDYDQETINISMKFTKMHADYTDKIIQAMEQSVKLGTPVNPPIWWVDPEDEVAQGINDEFLLGEDLLVAPVLREGAVSRDIYLPRGRWRDGLRPDSPAVQGPAWLRDYPAALNELPFFTLLK